MADGSPDTPRSSEAGPDTGGRGSAPGMPRWVKVFVIIGVALIVLVIVGLLTGHLAPGGGHGPGRHLGAGTATPPTDAPAGAGGPADATTATRTIAVTASDSLTFEPGSISVSAGETITFVVTNTGRQLHEFTVGDAAMQQQHAQAMAHIPDHVAPHFTNSLSLPPGETGRLTWRFGDASSLEYACHVDGHYEAGMRAPITVT